MKIIFFLLFLIFLLILSENIIGSTIQPKNNNLTNLNFHENRYDVLPIWKSLIHQDYYI